MSIIKRIGGGWLKMKRILEINDEDIGQRFIENVNYKPRITARAVLRKGNEISLLYVSKYDYHKLPGGGVEEGESIKDALEREILEEIGCTINVLGEIGEIIEHKSYEGIVQTSHCFIAEVVKEGESNFTQEEINDGFEVVWVTLEEAIRLLTSCKTEDVSGKFKTKRDLEFLKSAKEGKE